MLGDAKYHFVNKESSHLNREQRKELVRRLGPTIDQFMERCQLVAESMKLPGGGKGALEAAISLLQAHV